MQVSTTPDTLDGRSRLTAAGADYGCTPRPRAS